MIKAGQFNRLRIVKEVPFGIYLDGGRIGEILLPKKYIPTGAQIGDSVNVFIYFDSEDKIIATTQHPKAQVGCFALLKVIDVNYVGAFLDWGLDKDLLVPRSEQQRPMEKDKSYIIYVTQDQDERIIASSKLDHFLDKSAHQFTRGEEVDLLIAETTPLGSKVIINDSHWGLIHAGEIFQRIRYGDRIHGYIKTVREDRKIDVVLKKFGQDRIQELAAHILTKLQKEGGFLPLHDKSSSLEIQRAFGESKKSFKNAIGNLYKSGKIDINPDGIRLRGK